MLLEIIASQKQFIKTLPTPEKIENSSIDLYAFFSKPGKKYIFEVKKKSPSRGLMSTLPSLELAKTYAPYADVLSVLANETYFNGSFKDIKNITMHLSKPILCKDVIIDPIQVLTARAHGAHAVLLMLSALDDATYLQCQIAAHQYHMAVVTEVMNEEEVQRALNLNAKLILINNRNLFNLEENLATTARLADIIPSHIPIISASSIHTREDINVLSNHATGFLIGSSLSLAPNTAMKLRELSYGRVKICGLTRPVDAINAYRYGAMMGGLNFIPESMRYVTLQEAKVIKNAAPLQWFGIFSNQTPDEISRIALELKLDAIHIYDRNDAHFYQQLRTRLPKVCQIFQTMHVDAIFDFNEIDAVILDSKKSSLAWIKGVSFDWSVLKQMKINKPYLLAGGLSPENILDAQKVGAYGFDVNSGVESAPRIKDCLLIEQFFNKLKRGI